MRATSPTLPDGALHALTWSIPPQFGGLTKAMLQRSCQIATATGRPVVVLTVAAQADLDAERSSLRERGLLVDGVSIRNMWEDLSQDTDDLWSTAEFDPRIASAELDGPADDVEEVRRPDGSVIARMRWGRIGEREPASTTPWGHAVVRTEISGRDGSFLGGWHGVWPLWSWWLDRVITRPAHLIVDSANMADCLAVAPIADVPTTLVVHNCHIADGRDAPYGRLTSWRSFLFVRADRFDAVVYLTRAQRDDVDLLFGPQTNAHVVPNALASTQSAARRRRPAARGIVMASLEKRKRVAHAVRAVAEAAKSAPRVELALYGDGAERDTVTSTIDEHQAPARLEGHTSDPAGAFAKSSFMLLTSSREGFPLVLAESMAAGCLPIAYDLTYGPADIVRDDVDGFLVRAGDVQALADRIVDVATASRSRLRRMRKAARQRAAAYLPEAVLPLWGPVLDAATRASARRERSGPSLAEMAELERVSGLHRYADCKLEATGTEITWDGDTVTLMVSCSILGAADTAGRPDVDVELVHRPTGMRSESLRVEVLTPEGPAPTPPAATLRITIDTATIDPPADHVLLLRARLGAIDVLDTIRSPAHVTWLPLPLATKQRPVLLPDRRGGVRLVTATPHVSGQVELTANVVTVDVEALSGPAMIDALEVKGLGLSASQTIQHAPDGRYHVSLTHPGRWKIRARLDGTWRDVAWRGPGSVPISDGPVHVELSPRGYLRLRYDEV